MSAKDQIKQLVDYFKREPYLKDKTDAMGEGLMLGASLADEANELSKDVQAQVDQLVVEGDSSVEAAQARVDASGKAYTTLKKRLDENEQETTAQIQQKVTKVSYYADKALMNGRIDSLTDGFKETFDTYADLVTKYPTKTSGNFVVKEDQNWYFWLDGFGWTSGGKYPASNIANESISSRTLAINSVGIEQTNFITLGTNLFDKNQVVYGSYITSSDGELVYRDNPAMNTILIRIEAETQYYIDSTDFYHYFFDINDKEVGFGGHASNTLNDVVVTSPANAAYLAVNVKNTNARFEKFVICKGSKKPITLFPSTLNENVKVNQSQIIDGSNRQLFNKNAVTEWEYNFNSNPIAVEYGDKIIHNIGFKNGAQGVKPFAFYNSKNQIIQETEYGPNTQIPSIITVPENAAILIISIFKSFSGFTFNKEDLENVMVFKGERLPSLYVPFGHDMNDFVFSEKFYTTVDTQLQKKHTQKVVTVKKDGTGNYTTLKQALAFAVPNTLIKIYPGTYDLTTEYTTSEWQAATFYGYATKNGVDVEAIGDFGSVILKADLPEGSDSSHVSRISTIHVVEGAFTWKNILFVGGNVRYAGHDDDSRTVGDVRFERCKWLKIKNKGTYPNAFAGGWFNKKSDKYFIDCEFETEWENMFKDHAAFSYHSRTNTTEKHLIHLENCSATIGGQGSEFRFGGMKGSTGINSTLKLIGNRIKRVFIFEEGYTANGIDLDVLGYANTDDLEVCVHVTEGQRKPEIKLTGNVKMTGYTENWTN